ncbi:hypothetical protein LXL04_020485 [Taraxacum kok-saghyz]
MTQFIKIWYINIRDNTIWSPPPVTMVVVTGDGRFAGNTKEDGESQPPVQLLQTTTSRGGEDGLPVEENSPQGGPLLLFFAGHKYRNSLDQQLPVEGCVSARAGKVRCNSTGRQQGRESYTGSSSIKLYGGTILAKELASGDGLGNNGFNFSNGSRNAGCYRNANQSTTSILIFDDETRTIRTPQFEKCIPFDPMAIKEAEKVQVPNIPNTTIQRKDMDRFAPALTLLFLLLLLCCGGQFWFPCCCGSVFAGVLASLPLFSLWCFADVVLLFGWKNMLYGYYRCDIDTLI